MNKALVLRDRPDLSRSADRLRKRFWKKVVREWLYGDSKKAIQGIAAYLTKDVPKARKFLKNQ